MTMGVSVPPGEDLGALIADDKKFKARLAELREAKAAADAGRDAGHHLAAQIESAKAELQRAEQRLAEERRKAVEQRALEAQLIAEARRQNDAAAEQLAKDKADLEASIRKHQAETAEAKAWVAHQHRELDARGAALVAAEKRVAEKEAEAKATLGKLAAIRAAANI